MEFSVEQFKAMDDLRDYVKELGKFCARAVITGEHPMLYLDHSEFFLGKLQ